MFPEILPGTGAAGLLGESHSVTEENPRLFMCDHLEVSERSWVILSADEKWHLFRSARLKIADF